jgi:hypothetical protein
LLHQRAQQPTQPRTPAVRELSESPS